FGRGVFGWLRVLEVPRRGGWSYDAGDRSGTAAATTVTGNAGGRAARRGCGVVPVHGVDGIRDGAQRPDRAVSTGDAGCRAVPGPGVRDDGDMLETPVT